MSMRGTLISEYIRCGKPNCRCATDPSKRHGPYWYWVWRQGGKRHKHYVSKKALPAYQAVIESRRAVQQAIRDAMADIAAWKASPLYHMPRMRIPTGIIRGPRLPKPAGYTPTPPVTRKPAAKTIAIPAVTKIQRQHWRQTKPAPATQAAASPQPAPITPPAEQAPQHPRAAAVPPRHLGPPPPQTSRPSLHPSHHGADRRAHRLRMPKPAKQRNANPVAVSPHAARHLRQLPSHFKGEVERGQLCTHVYTAALVANYHPVTPSPIHLVTKPGGEGRARKPGMHLRILSLVAYYRPLTHSPPSQQAVLRCQNAIFNTPAARFPV